MTKGYRKCRIKEGFWDMLIPLSTWHRILHNKITRELFQSIPDDKFTHHCPICSALFIHIETVEHFMTCQISCVVHISLQICWFKPALPTFEQIKGYIHLHTTLHSFQQLYLAPSIFVDPSHSLELPLPNKNDRKALHAFCKSRNESLIPILSIQMHWNLNQFSLQFSCKGYIVQKVDTIKYEMIYECQMLLKKPLTKWMQKFHTWSCSTTNRAGVACFRRSVNEMRIARARRSIWSPHLWHRFSSR